MKIRIAALALLAVLALSGCAEGATETAASSERSTAQEAAVSGPSEPLAAETPTPAPQAESDDAFVAWVRDHLRPDNIIPNATDEQLVAAGQDGCAQIRSEVAPDDLTVIAGEERDGGGYFRESSIIITGARMFLCPDRIDG